MPFCSVSVVKFEEVNAFWDVTGTFKVSTKDARIMLNGSIMTFMHNLEFIYYEIFTINLLSSIFINRPCN